MGKISIAAGTAILALVLGATTPSIAQTSSGEAMMGTMNGHHMTRAAKLMGEPVYNAQGQQIGRINAILIDPTGGPAMVVLSSSKGGKMMTMPISEMKMNNGKMETQLQMEKMHDFDWNTFYGGGGG